MHQLSVALKAREIYITSHFYRVKKIKSSDGTSTRIKLDKYKPVSDFLIFYIQKFPLIKSANPVSSSLHAKEQRIDVTCKIHENNC